MSDISDREKYSVDSLILIREPPLCRVRFREWDGKAGISTCARCGAIFPSALTLTCEHYHYPGRDYTQDGNDFSKWEDFSI